MQDYSPGLLRRALPASKAIVPFAIAGICLWILHQRLGSGVMADIGLTLSQMNPVQWLLAALATAVSFWAVGRYDVVIHRHIGTGCNPGQAGIVGAASIALGQVLGMGAIVGALARWRMLKGLSPAQATRIALTVTVSFFFGLLGIFSLVSLIGPVAIVPGYVSAILILSLCCIAFRSFINPTVSVFGRQMRLLSLPALGQIMVLTLIDTVAAALALWVLMPQGVDIGFAALLPVYLAALAAALVTGTPGGVGPFELTLLMFFPYWPEAEIMSGIVAFRLVYYALPAVIAMVVLCRGFSASHRRVDQPLFQMQTDLLKSAPRAELNVCRQNGAGLLHAKGTVLAVATTPQAQVALFDPLRGTLADAAGELVRLSRSTNRAALIYKTTARQAALCRQLGLKVFHIADDMVVTPEEFGTEGPAHRQLRRKLRQAEKAGIECRLARALPVSHLRAIDAEWQARSGRAFGFSMGVFCPEYLSTQRVYIAYLNDVVVGFASFHLSRDEICLDLMRTGADAPDGTMHQLVATAIRDAAAEGRARLSLAAVTPASHANRAFTMGVDHLCSNGLTRFKTSFAPARRPLYAVSPSWPGMALALLDVARAIRLGKSKPVHIDDEEYGFAHHLQT